MKKINKYFWKEFATKPLNMAVDDLHKTQNDVYFKKLKLKTELSDIIANKDDFTEILIILLLISHSKVMRMVCESIDYEISMADKDDFSVPDAVLGNVAIEITAAGVEILRYKKRYDYEISRLKESTGGEIRFDENGKMIFDMDSDASIKANKIMDAINKKFKKNYVIDNVGLAVWPGATTNHTINFAFQIYNYLIVNNYDRLKEILKKCHLFMYSK